MAADADALASTCKYGHRQGHVYNEILFGDPNLPEEFEPLATATDYWWNRELANYTSGHLYTFSRSTGHFTQMAWPKATKMGCAMQACQNAQEQGFQGLPADHTHWTYVVCSYDIGNVSGSEELYQPGEPCSACPEDRTCNDGLCAAQ